MLEDIDLNYLKQRKEYITSKIQKYHQELKFINTKLDKFKKCSNCRNPYINEDLRTLTTTELEIVEAYDEEEFDNDSCYHCFEEDSLYCEKCIKHRMNNINICTEIEEKN